MTSEVGLPPRGRSGRKTDLTALPSVASSLEPRPRRNRGFVESTARNRFAARSTALVKTTNGASIPTRAADGHLSCGRLRVLLSERGGDVGRRNPSYPLSKLMGRYYARANVYPRKQRPEQIDAAVALIMPAGGPWPSAAL